MTVTALSGVHEVARELENPFRNVPNEIPLATIMAEANEALITMYAGYHPDFFWADAAKQYSAHEEAPKEPKKQTSEPNICRGKENGAKINQLEDKINQLVMKIEEQNREIDLLRTNTEDEKKLA